MTVLAVDMKDVCRGIIVRVESWSAQCSTVRPVARPLLRVLQVTNKHESQEVAGSRYTGT